MSGFSVWERRKAMVGKLRPGGNFESLEVVRLWGRGLLASQTGATSTMPQTDPTSVHNEDEYPAVARLC